MHGNTLAQAAPGSGFGGRDNPVAVERPRFLEVTAAKIADLNVQAHNMGQELRAYIDNVIGPVPEKDPGSGVGTRTEPGNYAQRIEMELVELTMAFDHLRRQLNRLERI